ncbi:MAG: lasso peptide isopeptide bond-forming cyclase [Burkholderiales bacterium]|nr:lasso peptide isopeptide bond-forming cyclase [Anaerolineae bacterium]
MSAIFGIVYLDGRPIDPADVARMDAALAVYGPDDAGVWREGSVALGHRMLWNTPESLHEKLPLRNAAGNVTLTADARIDNRDELLPVLGLPSDTTDSAVILAAYEKWGEDCVEHLLGDFAFAIWDESKRALFCARDHLGVKPFYYYHAPGKAFIFATAIEALLGLTEVPRQLDELMIGDFLAATLGSREDKSATFYTEILRLTPAHTLTIDERGRQMRRYWAFDPTREIHLGSNEEYAQAFLGIFTEALRCRMRTAYPLGSDLSGGLDSSSVTCLVRKILDANGGGVLHTFYSLPLDPENDERGFVKTVLDSGSYQHHEVERRSALAEFGERWWPGGLFFNNTLSDVNTYAAVKANNVRAVLNGWDGDTAVSHGMEYLVELANRQDWAEFAREAHGLSEHFGGTPRGWLREYGYPYLNELAQQHRLLDFARSVNEIPSHIPISRRKLIRHSGWKAWVPAPMRHAWRMVRPGKPVQPRWYPLNPTIQPAFARRVGLDDYLRTIERPAAKTERGYHYTNVNTGFTPMGYEEVARMAAEYTFEPRYPFQDIRLIEFCLALPPQQKLHQGWNRMVLRRAMEGILPKEIQWRGGKSHLSCDYTLRLFSEDRAQLDEALLSEPTGIEQYVDVSLVRDLYQEYLGMDAKGRDVHAIKGLVIWKAAMLAIWLNRTTSTDG